MTKSDLPGRLDGRIAIITGAASGIGEASAHLFAQEGAQLLLLDHSEAVRDVSQAIEETGGRTLAMVGDAGDEGDVAACVSKAVDTFGGLHIFFANAGITGAVRGGFFDASPEDWLEVLRVNLIGPFLAVKHAAPAIGDCGGGSIVCTASVAGLRSGAGPAQYSASKAGVINLVQTAAQQLAGSNIRVNAVLPGLTETGMTKPIFDGARAAGKEHKIGQLNPLLRGGQAAEIAHAALFLASDEASYVNGQALAVDGGLSSSHPTARPPGDSNRPTS